MPTTKVGLFCFEFVGLTRVVDSMVACGTSTGAGRLGSGFRHWAQMFRRARDAAAEKPVAKRI